MSPVGRRRGQTPAGRAPGLGRRGCAARDGTPALRSLSLAGQTSDRVAAVDIQGLTKAYGAIRAVDDVTLTIEPGEIVALLGPNGAGKTTLIGCVAGLIKPTSGTIRVHGHDALRDHRAARRIVGLVPQEINFDPFFDVEESLRFQAGYFGVDLSEARLLELLAALGLADKRHARTRALSGGMKRRLLIGKALVHEPRVLFLDEPTAGVDLELRRELWRYVRLLRDRGTTIVLTTHYLDEAEELADRIGLIHRGRLLLVEDKANLLDRFGERIVRLVLGAAVGVVPPALVALGARVVDEGRALELTLPVSGEVGAAVAAAAEAGLIVRDVESRRTGLEEVYVKIVGGGGSHGSAGGGGEAPLGGGGSHGSAGRGGEAPLKDA